MSNQGQPEGESSDGSSYIGISQLLNNIARDLDHMLDELGQSSTLPSPCASSQTDEFATAGEERSHYRRATGLPSNQLRIRNSSGDALLEQFVQNLIDSLTLPGTPFDGRSPVQSPDSSLCPLGLSGGGQEIESNGKEWRVDNEEYGEDQPCDISMVERIARTHPVWFLPGITRPGAVHLLQGKDPGNFIVRKSSKNNTMAISVRLPDDKGPYIEHYLIENIGREYRLEGSDNCFEAVPTLVAHYCQCCDELPVQLTLPNAIKQAMTRQELSSLAMLGQDYWVSSFATSPTEKTKSHTLTSSPVMTTFGQRITVSPPSNNCNAFHSSTTSLTSTTESTSENNTLPINKPTHPPPPPPRWCKPPPTNNTNITVTTSVSFNLNHNSKDKKREKEDVRPVNGSPKRPQALIEAKNPKVVRRRKKSTHYTHSNVVDSPPDYYRSSLADKISDYEDIWGAPVKSENTRKQNSNKVELVTFKPSPPANTASPLPSKRTVKEIKEIQENGHKSEGTSMSDASSSKSSPSSTLSSSPSSQSSRLRNKLGLTVATGTSTPSSSPVVKKHSSPFYAEPVDSLQSTNGHKTGSTNQLKAAANANRRKVHPKPTLLPARLLSHRHSDPNIQWPLAKNGGILETIYASDDAPTPTTTLSSSLDNLNGHRRLTRSRGQVVPSGLVNGGFSSHLVNEHRVMVDMETQTTPSNVTKGRGKAESPKKLHISIPKLIPYKGNNDNSWPVDSSWEWLGNENESQLDDSDLEDEIVTVEELLKKDAKFPLVEFRKDTSMDSSSLQCSDRITVEDLIQQKSPDLHVPEIQPLTKSNLLRVSEYDNLDDSRDDNNCPVRSVHERDNLAYAPSESASSMTEFSEPWDSSRWDQILQLINEPQVIEEEEEKEWKENNFNASIEENEKNKIQGKRHVELLSLDVVNEAVMSCNLSMMEEDDGTSLSSLPTVDIDKDISHCAQGKIQNFIPSTYIFTAKGKNNGLGDSIREYVLRLSQDKSTTFGKTIENFIQCTLDSHETSPHIVMRNVRQFMSGIKNYLVKHGEGQFEMVVHVERSKLKANEFLNLDAILEGVLHKIVIKPLKKHVYQLFVNEYTKNGALKLLSDNIKFARAKTPEEFGVKPEFTPPKNTAMDTVHHFLRRLQQVYSPMKKLENLLSATACIFSSVQNVNGKEEKSMGADDYLPMLMYVLVHCGMIAAEIEADYMWGLLHPSLLIGEGGYYLTTLSSAVDVLKNFQKCHDDKRREFNSIDTKENEMHGFMKIMIPDELNGSIISKTFPVRPSMSTKEVGKMIAHRFNITNPQDYGLFKLINGEETLLMDAECPHTLHTQLQVAAVDCAFAYKRIDAKIAWPITSKKS